MNKVSVNIYGNLYTLKSDKPKDFILKVASIVNDEIDMISSNLSGYSKTDIVILACNNIAEKYLEQVHSSLDDNTSQESLLSEISNKNRDIASLKLQLEQKDIKIKSLEMTDLSSKSLQSQIEKTSHDYEEKISEYKEINSKLESKFYDLQIALAEKEQEIENLKSQKK